MLFEKILYFFRKKAASQQSEQAPLRSVCTFFAFETGTLPTRIIPSVIYSLAPNEIFVFGSNALGMHHSGAARVAYNEFGAEWGNGEGLQGQSYSIPTMEGEHNTKLAIMRFTCSSILHGQECLSEL